MKRPDLSALFSAPVVSRPSGPLGRSGRFYAYGLLLLLGVSLLHQASAAPAAGPRIGPIRVIEVPVSGPEALDTLVRAGFDIAGFRNSVATIYADDSERADLTEMGFVFSSSAEESMQKAPAGYHTYESLTEALHTLADEYPNICRVESIGQSTQGREIWAILISDNPSQDEDEPECKFLSTMNGDEPVGTDLCLRFVEWLLSEYGRNSRITTFVDETATWVLPLVNPDGYVANSRFNARYYDLNRSFPIYPDDFAGTWYDGCAPDIEGREAEVRVLMNWMLANSFTLSANFHTGATLVNYPYDEDGMFSRTNAPTPDDDLFRFISRQYSRYNLDMWNSGEFSDGITNGSAWYVIYGGMQDWNYRYLACNEVTVELCDKKAPAAGKLPELWEKNRESMLSYLETVHRGIRGIVSDGRTGRPLWAEVRVKGNDHAVYTDPDVGDYHRMLLPGAYDLEIGAHGYVTKRFENVTVTDGEATRVNAALSDGDINGDGKVNVLDIQLVINAIFERPVAFDCDIDGGGVAATDLQTVVNIVLR